MKRRNGFEKIKEFRIDSTDPMYEKMEVGQVISAQIFEKGDILSAQGTSKGKGFQGVVKRHGFKGGDKSHGNKDQLRMPGSIGATGPARVFKGVRMGGHMGDDLTTIKNLEIIKIDIENNELYIKGSLPGARQGIVYLSANGEFDIAAMQKSEIAENQNKEEKGNKEKEIVQKDKNSSEKVEVKKKYEK